MILGSARYASAVSVAQLCALKQFPGDQSALPSFLLSFSGMRLLSPAGCVTLPLLFFCAPGSSERLCLFAKLLTSERSSVSPFLVEISFPSSTHFPSSASDFRHFWGVGHSCGTLKRKLGDFFGQSARAERVQEASGHNSFHSILAS